MPNSSANHRPSAASRATVASTGSLPSRSTRSCQIAYRSRAFTSTDGSAANAARSPSSSSRGSDASTYPCTKLGPAAAMSRSNSVSQRSTSASISSRFVPKWYSSPPLDTPASCATASSVSACGPSRRTTAPAASRSLSLVRACGIQPDHAEHDKAQRGELERIGGFAVRDHADQRDGGGPDGGPDRVRGADREVLEHEREEPERDAIAHDD